MKLAVRIAAGTLLVLLAAGARADDQPGAGTPPTSPNSAAEQAAPAPVASPALEQPASLEEGQRVRVTVRAIAATHEAQNPAVDLRLAPIAQDLRAFAGEFNYTAYRLVEEQTFDLDWKAPAQMELPGQRSLLVTPRALGADGRIRVHLELLGEHPEHIRRLHTDYSVPRGRTILVGGYRLDPRKPESGTLLIAITQAVEK